MLRATNENTRVFVVEPVTTVLPGSPYDMNALYVASGCWKGHPLWHAGRLLSQLTSSNIVTLYMWYGPAAGKLKGVWKNEVAIFVLRKAVAASATTVYQIECRFASTQVSSRSKHQPACTGQTC